MAQEVRKKRGRPRLDEWAKKLNIKAKNGRRIYLGIEGSKRWMQFKSQIGEVTDAWLIGHILDVHDKFCPCRASGMPLKTTLEQASTKSKTEDGNKEGTHTATQQIEQDMTGPLGEEEMVKYVRNLAKMTSTSTSSGQSSTLHYHPNDKNKNSGAGSDPNTTDTNTESGHVGSNPSEQGHSWKFVHFPTSWKFGDRLAIDLTFHHTPSMNLMAQGMTRTLALNPPEKGPDSERQLAISNFLELYFTAKMMERLGVLIQYSKGCVSANLYIILQKWMHSFFGITANIAEVKLKAERVIQHFQRLESIYNKNQNEKNFECLGDFLLSSLSNFWKQDSNKKSSQPSWTSTNTGNGQQGQQPSWDALGGPARNELDFMVYKNNEGEDMETDVQADTRRATRKRTSEATDDFEIKQEPMEDEDSVSSISQQDGEEDSLPADSSQNQFVDDDSEGGLHSVSSRSDLTDTLRSTALEHSVAVRSDLGIPSGSSQGHLDSGQKPDDPSGRHCNISQMPEIDQLTGSSEINSSRSYQAQYGSTQQNQSQPSFSKEGASGGHPQRVFTRQGQFREDVFLDQEDPDSEEDPTPNTHANVRSSP